MKMGLPPSFLGQEEWVLSCDRFDGAAAFFDGIVRTFHPVGFGR